MKAAQRATELLTHFKLTVAAEQLVPRLHEADLDSALPIVAAVLEQEQETRHARRVERLRRASKLSTDKTFE